MRIFLLVCTFIIQSNASVSQGKLIYAKECLSCHINGKYFASTKKAKEWKHLFIKKDNKDKLANLHLNIEEAKESWSYFNSQDYSHQKKHLKNLLQKYSSDRGKHNSCY